MPLSPLWRRILYGELYAEALINVVQGALAVVLPAVTQSLLTRAGAPTCDAVFEAARAFGALNFVFGGVLLLRVLTPFEPRALKLLLEVLLLGDVVYLSAFTPFALKYGAMPGALAPYLATLPMAICRVLLRVYEDWPALDGAAARAPLAAADGGD